MRLIYDLLKEAYTSWDDAEALGEAGRELHDRNRLPFAREVLERALELAPGASEKNWEYLAYCHFRSFHNEEGLAILRRGIEEAGFEVLKAVLAGFTEDEKEAEAIRAEFEKSDDPVLQAHLWWSKLHGGQAKEAHDAVRALFDANPDNEDLRDLYLWMILGAKNKGVEGLDARELGLPIVQQKIDADPLRMSGHWTKAELLWAEKDFDGLLAATEEALAHLPDEETLLRMRGWAFREKGDEDRAIACFCRAIGAKPSFAGARVDLGRLYEKQGKLELAEETFEEIPKANPDYPIGPMSMVLFCARQGRLDEAEERLRKAWPNVPKWFRGSLAQNPEAAPLLERESVKELIGPMPESKPEV